MAAALRSFYFCIVFSVSCGFSLALVPNGNQFIYNGFSGAEVQLFGAFVQNSGLLQLTSSLPLNTGYAYSRFPIRFNRSSSQSFSFSTNFVFAMVPELRGYAGHGIAFVIFPTLDFSQAGQSAYFGLFNATNNGLPTNHILAVELDTEQTPGFNDLAGEHVGIDVNILVSVDSALATYFSDKEGKNESLVLGSGNPTQVWIDYNGAEKLLNVTVAPMRNRKPSRPLLSKSLDLSEILLDSMHIGFFATTGRHGCAHYILGWSFNRTRPGHNLEIRNLPSLPTIADNSVTSKSNYPPELMIIVLIIAAVVVMGQ